MNNPIRRNRNIGTPKQGHGQNNELVIPFPAIEMKAFFERLGEYKTIERKINNHNFKFVIEKTRKNSFHACTIDDIEKILLEIPVEDYKGLELIILRQPTRKEENLKSVWGRLIYSYEFENDYSPAIIIESVDLENTLKWSKKLSVDSQKELERLKEDGHKFITSKRYYEAEYELDNIRTTQLYRTLLHEIGHYVHFLEVVKRPLSNQKKELDLLDIQIDDNDNSETNPLYKKWESLFDSYHFELERLDNIYHSISTNEKETFAHSYADKLKKQLENKNVIPFERILNKKTILDNRLNLTEFEKETEHNTVYKT